MSETVILSPSSGLVFDGQAPVLALPMALLFKEFLRRYEELRLAKRREAFWFAGAVGVGLFALSLPWLFPKTGVFLGGICLIWLYYFLRKYIRMNAVVNHINVNVHILHHHLLGKLEVGFCYHSKPCSCAENFRSYVWDTYHISL